MEVGSDCMYLFIEYPKCSTCQKAKRFLEEHKIEFVDRHIVTENPTYEELREWVHASGYPISKFFNTSGMVYRELGLKDELPKMSEEDQLQLLASNGMLVKRPLLIGPDRIFVGFRESEWEML